MQQKLSLTVLRALAVTFSLSVLGSYVVFSQRKAQIVPEPPIAYSSQAGAPAPSSEGQPISTKPATKPTTWIISGSKSFAGPVVVADQLASLELTPPASIPPPPTSPAEAKSAPSQARTIMPGSKYGPIDVEAESIIAKAKTISLSPTQKITLPGLGTPSEPPAPPTVQGQMGLGLHSQGQGSLVLISEGTPGLMNSGQPSSPPSVLAEPKPSQVMASTSKSGAVFFVPPSVPLQETLTITEQSLQPTKDYPSLVPRWDLREALDDVWKRIHLGLGLDAKVPPSPEDSTSGVLERNPSGTMPLPASHSLTPPPQP